MTKKTKNLEDIGELLKKKKPTKEKTIVATISNIERSGIMQISKGLKIFR